MRKLLVLPVIGVLAVLSMAAAAGLNIDNTPTAQVGSDTDLTCDNAVQVYFNNNWDATDNQFEVATVTVAGISGNCDGKTVKVQLTAGGNEVGPTLGLTYTDPTNPSFDFSSYDISTLSVTDVHVVIQ